MRTRPVLTNQLVCLWWSVKCVAGYRDVSHTYSLPSWSFLASVSTLFYTIYGYLFYIFTSSFIWMVLYAVIKKGSLVTTASIFSVDCGSPRPSASFCLTFHYIKWTSYSAHVSFILTNMHALLLHKIDANALPFYGTMTLAWCQAALAIVLS